MAITPQPISAYQSALYSLLPSGEYWQKDADDELDKILQVLAEQLQAFDSQLLTAAQNSIQPVFSQPGHSQIEYQQLLLDNGITATITDNSGGLPFLAGHPAGQKLGKHHNRACIIITSSTAIDESIKQIVEQHKQSHTHLIWRVS
jgi:hypothetical protein